MQKSRQDMESEIAVLRAERDELKRERQEYLQDRAIIAMMSDSDNAKFDQETIEQIAGQHLKGNRFALLAFMDRASEPGTRDEEPVWESLNSTFYQTLCGYIRPVFIEMGTFLTANFNGCIYSILNLKDSLSPEAFVAQCRNYIGQINDEMEKQEGFRFHVMVSPIGFGIPSLTELRKDLDAMREYCEILGNSAPELLFYADFAYTSPEEKHIALRMDNQEQFSDYINRGDFDLARHFFHEHIVPSLLVPGVNATTIRLRVAGLLDYVIQTITRASYELGLEQALDEIGAANLLLSAETLEDVEQQMDFILDAFATQWNAAGKANQRLASATRKYIDENYGNPGLNVNMVADHFGVSASYLTRVFRRCYQKRVLDYIQQVRIRAAKSLLGTGISLKEIAEATGYGAQINLIRAFKKLEGVTPRQFEESRKSPESING